MIQWLDYLMTLVWCIFILITQRFSTQKKHIIAITLIEHMGDIIACEPVSRYMRNLEPDSFIIWFVTEPYKEIVDTFDSVDAVRTIHCLTTWSRLRNLNIFDRIVDLHINGRICPQCQIPHDNPDGDISITLENYFDHGPICEVFCKAAGLPPLSDQPLLHTPEAIRRSIDKLGLAQPYLVIHCRSNESSKEWHPEKWTLLLERLLSAGLKVIEVGHDSALYPVNASGYQDFCGKLSIIETAEVIRRSRLFVGIDSGPAHLANAVGTPGVVLLGEYRAFKRYQPFTGSYADGTKARLVYSNGSVNLLSVNAVYGEIMCSLGVQEQC